MLPPTEMPADRRRQVVVRFSSGLGNQLFQLACGLRTAKAAEGQLFADTTWYGLVAPIHRPIRRFRLPKFSVELPEAFRGPRRLCLGLAAAVFDRWNYGRKACEQIGQMQLEQEIAPMSRQETWNGKRSGGIYLNGYWQTADHFLAVRDELISRLSPLDSLSTGAQNWIARTKTGRAGFIHIRRGDYAKLAGENGLLPVEYYRRAARAMAEKGEKRHWLVFAEDETWARQHMGFLSDWELVSYQSANRDIEDLLIMKACSAGIIANSSYSWWGAALGDRPGRPVVAPEKYWRYARFTSEDWRLPAWLSVEAWD